MQNDPDRSAAAASLADDMRRFLAAGTGRKPEASTGHEKWAALSSAVMERIAGDWADTAQAYAGVRQAHYFSAEFLVGRALVNNLMNLGLESEAQAALAEFGTSLEEIEEEEDDPGLGNGGLGRLAACLLDSCATLDMPVTGYGILYRYGLFRQKIEKGFQTEYPDPWLEKGYPWVIRRDSLQVKVHFDDGDVFAVPYDFPVTGYGTRNVNTLRLWSARPAQDFDYGLFNAQRFADAVRERNRAEDIWRVLYPNDSAYEGKVLRARQQYFFASASIQDIVRNHKARFGGDLSNFADYHTIQLNDTHPVIGIPELMRILTAENGMEWGKAWEITRNVFAYTNHTILAEALEKWDIGIFKYLFAGLYEIIARIDAQFRAEMQSRGMARDKIDALAPVGGGKVRMAWLAIYGSRSVNGVAELHTKILKERELKDWYALWPEKFSNKTNGITPRRWLCKANPELASMLDDLLGGRGWALDFDRAEALRPLASSTETLDRFMAVKKEKKKQLADYLERKQGVRIDPETLFDIQIKRLHEYKRQLLNALSILDLYFDIKSDPARPRTRRTFLFGAKAAPGYFRAKAVIKLINEIAKLVDGDPDASRYLQVVFVENYNVTSAEKLFPAADVSEQISAAGFEASGTGNMKFMINGAVTHGTYDGANVEIVEAAGADNEFIFGARVEDMPAIRGYYDPAWQYANVPGLKRAVDALVDGTLDDGCTGMFRDIYNSLLTASNGQPADVYYVLGDFEDYRKSRNALDRAYADPHGFAARCWINLCSAGRFSSDRTVKDYARDIWRIVPVKAGP